MKRQPIVAVLAHVDHGKTTLLDKIRNTAVASGEAGGITQEIGATVIPKEIIEAICGEQLKKMNINLTIPGLLFIDTPGHEAFTTLRKRGGSIADLAVLLVDVNEGIRPQTRESLDILKSYKVPFIVAANKIDRLEGWYTEKENNPFVKTIQNQRADVKERLDKKIYELVGSLHAEGGYSSERFDRVDDFTTQILIIPTSGKTGEGIPELLLFIAGLTQKYMEAKLETCDKPGKGTVLEVKEVQGLGTTIDAIIYDGVLNVGDTIVVGGKNGSIATKVRALLQPKPLQEIRDPKKKFDHVESVSASAGVKINAPNLDNAMAGSTVQVTKEENIEKIKEEIARELEQITIQKESTGVVVKADSIGSLEGIVRLFEQHNIPLKTASVGNLTRKDILEAEAVHGKDRYLGVVFAFNTPILKEAEDEAEEAHVKVFSSKIIYKLVEEYVEWKEKEREIEKEEFMKSPLYPVKLKLLPGCVFRSSKPAIVGVEVLEGMLKIPMAVMNEHGKRCGRIKEIQKDKENVKKAERGDEVAVSITNTTIGRQVNEGDVLYADIPLKEIPRLKKEVKEEEKLLEEIKRIKRTQKESIN